MIVLFVGIHQQIQDLMIKMYFLRIRVRLSEVKVEGRVSGKSKLKGDGKGKSKGKRKCKGM